MKVLITGGTGSIGSALARLISDDVTIFSRNESVQVEMKHNYSFKYIIGDVRDKHAIMKACGGMDYVFHFAALKHVEICEEQPMEAVKTNVIGTKNVINACYKHGAKLVNMSSDKAINSGNVYGKTKSLSEDIVTEAGYLSIRSGNVLWSAGSVLPIWKQQIALTNKINLTSKEMTRFFIHVDKLVNFIWNAKDKAGVLTVSMKSFYLYDIAIEFLKRYGDGETMINITGLRPGERLHEFRDAKTSSKDNICTDLTYIFQ